MIRRRRAGAVPLWLAVLSAAGCGLVRVDVVGDAMSPTLKNGDQVIATRRIDRVDRGDVVGFRYPRDESKSFVMRVVALPGEEIEMKTGTVLINGRSLEETYVADANRSSDSWGPKRIPDDEYFMMGDNRRNSSDSRSWGTVKRTQIWARVPVR
jgi:signal peptidase I